jgi:iron complex transport system substrate-binding protein
MMAPDNEAIAALSPDIVFTSGMSSVGGTSPFQSLVDSSVCVADIPSPSSIEGICDDIVFIGACTGKGREALAYAKGLAIFLNGIAEIGKQVPADQSRKVLVMMNVPSAEYPTVYTFGKGTYMNEMLEIIGAKNVFGDKEGWLSVSVEEVLAANPDVILMDCNWMPDAADQVKALAGWENVNAVKNGDVYAVDEDLCSRPNHHISEATLEWARLIYADQYSSYKQSFEDIKNDLWQQIVG